MFPNKSTRICWNALPKKIIPAWFVSPFLSIVFDYFDRQQKWKLHPSVSCQCSFTFSDQQLISIKLSRVQKDSSYNPQVIYQTNSIFPCPLEQFKIQSFFQWVHVDTLFTVVLVPGPATQKAYMYTWRHKWGPVSCCITKGVEITEF